MLHLDERLSALAELCGSCNVLADIGSDHGRLPAWLLLNDRCGCAWITDLSEISLQKARRLIDRLGLSDRVVFSVGDGADALGEAPDTAVIAGMGGDTVSHIIRQGSARLRASCLALAPNVDVPHVRQTLQECGYRIEAERIARAGGRLYPLIRAVPGEMCLTENETEVGPILLRDRPPELREMAAFRVRIARKAIAGAKKAGELLPEEERRCDIWEELL